MAESIEPKPIADESMFPTFATFVVGHRRRLRAMIAACQLPAEIAELISRVSRRTRLWPREKHAVARELIAHFQDGVDAGESPKTLVERFGDERTAARLIRRAKKRNRPLLWHVWKYIVRGVFILLCIVALLIARFLFSQPTVKVNYVALLNQPTLATPEDSRAWPIYRRALIALGMGKDGDKALDEMYMKDPKVAGTGKELTELTPTDPAWPIATSWLDAHAEGFDLLRQAAAKPNFGFILGRGGSQFDPELGWNFGQDRPVSLQGDHDPLLDDMVIGILLPSLNQLRESANLLQLDLRYAHAQHDSARAVADVEAMLGIATQQRDPIVVTRLVAIGIDAMTLRELEQLLATDPTFFTDAQLIQLAHRVSRIGGDTASSLIDLSAERMFFEDLIQRTFSDDGHGNGYLTAKGVRVWQNVTSPSSQNEAISAMALTGAVSMVCSRQSLLAEYDRLLNMMTSRYSRHLRETTGPTDPNLAYEKRIREIKTRPMLRARYLPIALLMPSLDRAAGSAEILLGQREGIEIGIALEMYHRQHSQYPEALSQLAPKLLPEVPVDRITGEPLKYRLADDHPLVYSVGADRDDDAGKMAKRSHGEPEPTAAADWSSDEATKKSLDGDWLLFDARPKAPATQPTR